MTTISRKKPGVAFWATVVLVVALAYPVSFGPACWKKKGRKKGPGRPGQDILECPLFSLAFGPACWITSRLDRGSGPDHLSSVYVGDVGAERHNDRQRNHV